MHQELIENNAIYQRLYQRQWAAVGNIIAEDMERSENE